MDAQGATLPHDATFFDPALTLTIHRHHQPIHSSSSHALCLVTLYTYDDASRACAQAITSYIGVIHQNPVTA